MQTAGTGDCPKVDQAILSNGQPSAGFAPGATPTVKISSQFNGTQSTTISSTDSAVLGSLGNVNAAGANIVSNVPPSQLPAPPQSGTFASLTAHPVSVILIGTRQDLTNLDPMCTSDACTVQYTDPNNNQVYYTKTIMLQSAVDSGSLQALVAHEFTHGQAGAADCDPANGNPCDKTDMKSPVNPNNTGPTDCDKVRNKNRKHCAKCEAKKHK